MFKPVCNGGSVPVHQIENAHLFDVPPSTNAANATASATGCARIRYRLR
jgi:hypothetical protein